MPQKSCAYSHFRYRLWPERFHAQVALTLTCETQVLELRFSNLDVDGAGTLSYNELKTGLAKLGFTQFDMLTKIFQQVDRDRNGVLDFREFMALTYIFSMQKGDLTFMFKYAANAKLLRECFHLLDKAVCLYDVDKNHLLNMSEVMM
jgi:Ca2+-binding EF-hand superfamily protein